MPREDQRKVAALHRLSAQRRGTVFVNVEPGRLSDTMTETLQKMEEAKFESFRIQNARAKS